jgi:UDP:flavonoid glycosyltransferase YjiC (YdhE family)
MSTVVLATSNGTGMGHLARQAATALALRERADPVLFSLSQALPLVRTLGLRGEYCPSTQRKLLTSVAWQQYLAERIAALVEETSARVFAFDGAYPYHGISLARRQLPEVAFVWVRRAMWKPGANVKALRKLPMFDAVLEPGDLAAAADRGATARLADVVRVPPVTLLEQVPQMSREQARAELGLDPERPAALVTLRTSSSGVGGAALAAVRAVLERPQWQIALTRTPLSAGELGVADDRIRPLRGVFPLASYLAAFDIAVTETGYNSCHEMLHSAVPTVFVPTNAAVTDDQQARARWAADQGLALSADEDDPARVARAVSSLLDEPVREKLADRCRELPAPTGAAEAAAMLADLARGFERHRFSASERVEMARGAVRPAASTMLGSRGLAAAERLAGRKSEVPPKPPGPVRFVEAAGPEDVSAANPVEDLLPGSSEAYRKRREEIARRYFPGL